MFDEEDIKKPVEGINRNLEKLSVAELEEYIQELEKEILRVKEDLVKKKDVFSAAESIFKS